MMPGLRRVRIHFAIGWRGIRPNVAPMRQVDLREALRDVAAVGPGMAVLGTSFGLLAVGSGLDWWWAPVFSVVVFAGSLEFLLVALAVAGTPLAAIAVTTVAVWRRNALLSMAAGTASYAVALALVPG